MAILFDEIVFGPVHSRRFGLSLGLNLLPVGSKFCTFDCIYCECGWTQKEQMKKGELPSFETIRKAMQETFADLDRSPDNITFAGNGEPTIHPDFPAIIDETIRLRNHYFPGAKVTVLSNASQLHKPKILGALKKADNNVLKLDAGTEEMFQKINSPAGNLSLDNIVTHLKKFNSGELTIQTLFLRGYINGERIDNTNGQELEHWLNHIKAIQPKNVMIYSLDREPPAKHLEKIDYSELQEIARKIEKAGINTSIY
ncbi:MAG: radical SAM protein [Bacteroidales bacterium]|nr:radical SAM protein [Bacteroidales bacterium]